jgi:hypothetical protein
MANLHLNILNPAVVYIYQPLLSFLSLGLDGYWYYAGVFGAGLGFFFSLGYPATFDQKLSSHPLVTQYEIRLIPVSFRTAGRLSVLLNLIVSFNMGYNFSGTLGGIGIILRF